MACAAVRAAAHDFRSRAPDPTMAGRGGCDFFLLSSPDSGGASSFDRPLQEDPVPGCSLNRTLCCLQLDFETEPMPIL